MVVTFSYDAALKIWQEKYFLIVVMVIDFLVEILQVNLQPFVYTIELEDSFIFQKYNSSKHTRKTAQNYFMQNYMQMLE